MKAIKITGSNSAAIEAALKQCNGTATRHVYTAASEIANIAADAERRLAELQIPIKDRSGALFTSRSGHRLPNAYKDSRIVNRVVLERRSAAWWLVRVESERAWNDAGSEHLHLTARQDEIAVAHLRAGYQIIGQSASGRSNAAISSAQAVLTAVLQ